MEIVSMMFDRAITNLAKDFVDSPAVNAEIVSDARPDFMDQGERPLRISQDRLDNCLQNNVVRRDSSLYPRRGLQSVSCGSTLVLVRVRSVTIRRQPYAPAALPPRKRACVERDVQPVE